MVGVCFAVMSRNVEELIDYLERLVLVKFSSDERAKLAQELPKILEFFRALDQVKELERYEPLFYVHDVPGRVRDDEPEEPWMKHEDLAMNAELVGEGYVKAPRTVVE